MRDYRYDIQTTPKLDHLQTLLVPLYCTHEQYKEELAHTHPFGCAALIADNKWTIQTSLQMYEDACWCLSAHFARESKCGALIAGTHLNPHIFKKGTSLLVKKPSLKVNVSTLSYARQMYYA